MTLLLDNRKNEMSNMVHQRMLYVRDQTRQDIEQILYFSRLGATHKDYYFEKISLKSICQESIEDNRTLLEEAGFSINYSGNENVVVSDKKGLMFILGQVISNSVKYTTKKKFLYFHFLLWSLKMRKTFYCLSAIMVPIFLSQIYLLYLTKDLLEILEVI